MTQGEAKIKFYESKVGDGVKIQMASREVWEHAPQEIFVPPKKLSQIVSGAFSDT